MSKLTYIKLEDELEELIKLYTQSTWSYHSDPSPTEAEIKKLYRNGWFSDDKETFWVLENTQKVGLLIIADISDTMPLFYDLRLSETARGKGFGLECINWATNYVFFSSKDKLRMEAYTRADNIAMRKVFSKSLFQKEGYLRSSWEHENGKVSDSLLYAVIRTDWEKGQKAPIDLNKQSF
ncbi:GNAT family N-acetyltransferase [Alkalihalobacillus sp. 1P02AB]|uniref:GNAT family N-acetyltransferase n=1 Tax=Alkalihalobacillus sp. 1P02AB TaxID=3132260 RepID=UPI0039A71DFA